MNSLYSLNFMFNIPRYTLNHPISFSTNYMHFYSTELLVNTVHSRTYTNDYSLYDEIVVK